MGGPVQESKQVRGRPPPSAEKRPQDAAHRGSPGPGGELTAGRRRLLPPGR